MKRFTTELAFTSNKRYSTYGGYKRLNLGNRHLAYKKKTNYAMVQTNERTSNECNIHNSMKTRLGKTVPYNKILPNIYLHRTKCEG